MFLLVISMLVLVLGPLLYRMADTARSTLLALDGFTMVTVSGLVLVHIIPHAVVVAGPLAVVLALVGFLGPGMVEHNLERAARQAHMATLILACAGLLVHEFFDGVALGAAVPEYGHHADDSLLVLAIAVVLHRLPVAITVWLLLRPIGLVTAISIMTGLGMATLLGFAAAGAVEPWMSESWVGLLQALVGGSLLHVVIHRPPHLPAPASAGKGQLHAGLGALAGLMIVIGVLADTHLPFQGVPGAMDFDATFKALVLESAPALLLGLVLAGMIQAFVPQAPGASRARWMQTGRPVSEALRGMAHGLSLRICSCGVVPSYRSLLQQGVPATAGMAFLIATPAFGVEAILISLPLLGAELTMVRIVAAALVAVLIGSSIGRLARSTRIEPDDLAQPVTPVLGEHGGRGSAWTRLGQGLRLGLGELVGAVGPWLLLGLVVAALVEPMLDGELLAQLPWGADVVLFTLLGMPTYVCATGATPLAAVLIHKGVSPGAALAFLLAGPAIHLTLLRVLTRLHGRRIALAFAGTLALLVIALGLATNLMLPDAQGLALHESAHGYWQPDLLQIASLVVLGAAFAVSVLRLGPRGIVAQIFPPHSDDHGHEDHDHDAAGDASSSESAGRSGHANEGP